MTTDKELVRHALNGGWLPRRERRRLFGNPKKEPLARRDRPEHFVPSSHPAFRKKLVVGPRLTLADDHRFPYSRTARSPRHYVHIFRDLRR